MMQTPIDAYLDKITSRIEHLRRLNLTNECERSQAVQESQHLLALIMYYRHRLSQGQPSLSGDAGATTFR